MMSDSNKIHKKTKQETQALQNVNATLPESVGGKQVPDPAPEIYLKLIL